MVTAAADKLLLQQKRWTLDGLQCEANLSGGISAKKTTVEAAAVVVSILVAFGIDASWDNLGDRRMEAEYVSALKSELQGSLSNVERTQRLRERVAIRLATLREDGPVSPDSLRAFLGDAAFSNNLSPRTAVLDDLVSTGRMQILRSRELREGLMELRHEYQIIALNEERHDGLVNERFIPALSDLVPLAELWEEGQGAGFLRRASEADLAAVQSDLAFQNLILERERAVLRGNAALERTRQLLERLIAYLESAGAAI